MTPVATRATTEADITTEVLRRFDATQDPRLKQIMQSLIRHIHGFVSDVQLSEAEWWKAIAFLTATGQKCDDKRQEFILLSDTLGISMLVDLISNRKPEGATESTVFGPFHRDGAPLLPLGGNIAPGETGGTPAIIIGRVLNLEGQPIAGAELDVWQTDSSGLYDSQRPELDHMHMRGIFHTGTDGRYLVRTIRPVHYQIPSDGPVGQMLRATNRHPWRPAHVHFKVSADGYQPVTTHVFDDIDEFLKADAVFGVKESLICHFTKHETLDAEAEKCGIAPPFCRVDFDFVLTR